jgi:hypothetical protein
VAYPAPENYHEFSSFELLGALWREVIPADHRLIHALVDEPARTLRGILDFAYESPEDRDDTESNVREDLVRLFNYLPTPEAVPFLVGEVRSNPSEISEELTEALVRVAAAAFDPLLALFHELEEAGEDTGEVAFLLATLGVRDPRMDDLLRRIEESDPEEAGFLRGIADGERGPLELYDIWKEYPEIDEPYLNHLPEEVVYELLESKWPSQRIWAAHALEGEEIPEEVDGTLEAMLEDADQPLAVRCAVAVLVAPRAKSEVHDEVVRTGYQEEATRPDALKAMYLTFDETYGSYMAQHLEDKNERVRYEALTGAGFLNVRSELGRVENLLKDPDWREDALFTYAMLAPGGNSAWEIRKLLERIREVAGGLGEEDEDIVKSALDTRLQRQGRDPVFFPDTDFAEVDDPFGPGDETEDADFFDEPIEPVRSEKVGRNAPCPCGSGKKYKKCCGK